MPELPEVESARQVLEGALHRTIRDALVGRELTVAHRRGKTMWCETSDDGPTLGIHLGMAGRVLVDDDRDRGKAEWTRFTATFEDGGSLKLFDKRRLGRVRLDPDLSDLGPDAGEVDRDEFRSRVGRGTAPLKARLLDQGTLAGVGNLLADEVLWQSRLDPHREAGDLDEDELDELRRQLRKAIRLAIRHGGVHTGEVIPHRARGEHCPRCGAEMARGTVGGRTTWWCSAEQA